MKYLLLLCLALCGCMSESTESTSSEEGDPAEPAPLAVITLKDGRRLGGDPFFSVSCTSGTPDAGSFFFRAYRIQQSSGRWIDDQTNRWDLEINLGDVKKGIALMMSVPVINSSSPISPFAVIRGSTHGDFVPKDQAKFGSANIHRMEDLKIVGSAEVDRDELSGNFVGTYSMACLVRRSQIGLGPDGNGQDSTTSDKLFTTPCCALFKP